ncbi:unnamed protein product [Pedinophyceae sp. YPF-701]|nr:unnamed protein product [Pedinophyceae sp. YPF-701]
MKLPSFGCDRIVWEDEFDEPVRREPYSAWKPTSYTNRIEEREKARVQALRAAQQARAKGALDEARDRLRAARESAQLRGAVQGPAEHPASPVPAAPPQAAAATMGPPPGPGMAGPAVGEGPARPEATGGGTGGGGVSFAQKMMQKMGWKEGQGLGRNRQGITAPLMMQKTGVVHGVVTVGDDTDRARGSAPAAGRVALLLNMVGPGEVDESLEDEVADECATKYGPVVRVVIFEVTTPGVSPEEAVRIFVEFKKEEDAARAVGELQGRFFGGRQLRATLFDEGRYNRQEFAP